MVLCMICSGSTATYGEKGKEKKYCKECAKNIPNVCDLTRKYCKESTCIKEPTYNYPSEKTTAYCTTHKLEGMINVKHKKCEYIDEEGNKCVLIPTYGILGEKPKYCKTHSELYENMVVLGKILCKYIDKNNIQCTTRASFNKKGLKTPKWCNKHKEEGDVFVLKAIYCEEKECNTRATFNYKNEKNPKFCNEHKKIGMVNIVDKRCEVLECIKMATHAGKDGIKKFCGEHKESDMMNIRAKKCAYDSCTKQPTFNYENSKIRLYCADHAEKDMKNIKNPMCKKCNIFEASFNFKRETKRLYCGRCKEEGMLNLKAKLCKNSYDIDGELYECSTYGNPKYDGYCVRCYTNLFPNEPKTKNYKTKEYKVYEYIKSHLPDTTIICDKVVPSGQSRRRPDMCILKETYNILIEIDEYQHNNYETICENKRMMELFIDLRNKPLVIIRFNPDSYINSKGIEVKSCWSFSREGLAIINRNKRDDWASRLNKLKENVEYYMENLPKKELEIVYLYYNEQTTNDDDI